MAINNYTGSVSPILFTTNRENHSINTALQTVPLQLSFLKWQQIAGVFNYLLFPKGSNKQQLYFKELVYQEVFLYIVLRMNKESSVQRKLFFTSARTSQTTWTLSAPAVQNRYFTLEYF